MSGIGIDPNAMLRQAIALLQAGRVADGAALCRRLLQAFPSEPRVLNTAATAEIQCGNDAAAIALFERSLAIQPDQASVLSNFGAALQTLGRLDEALTRLDRAVAVDPHLANAHYNRGNVLSLLGRHAEALASFDRVIALSPRSADAHNRRGSVLIALHRFDEALCSIDLALKINPRFVGAYINRARVWRQCKQLEAALADYDRALSLNPGLIEAYHNRSEAHRLLQNLEPALADNDAVLARSPDFAGAYGTRGNILLDLGRIAEAQAAFDRAIALSPDTPLYKWGKSHVALLTGDFAEGWRLFEHRHAAMASRLELRTFSQPQWQGEADIAGKRILLHAEQGFGDMVQFVRYAPMVAALGARVVVEAPACLLPLLRTLQGEFAFVATGDALPPFDLQCPLMSLPLAFLTTLATIPAPVPYLSADAEKRLGWRNRLGERKVPRIGLCWSGRSEASPDRKRSMAVRHLAPLLALPYEFHGLQKDLREDDAAFLRGVPRLHMHAEDFADFSDTAALIAELDLVISVDTVIAHVAGALGKPVWILLPWAGEWRWLQGRSDSPWYPSAMLFRQAARGDWDGVVAAIADQIVAHHPV